MVDMTLKPGGGKADKLMRDALLAVTRQDPEMLKRVSKKLWTMAEEGDTRAYALIADRIDGKAIQPIAHSLVEDTHDESSLDATIREIAGKVGLALSTEEKARAQDAPELPNIH